jgi:hypothetical protein
MYVIKEQFPDEQLLLITTDKTPWYADIVNYLVESTYPLILTFYKRKRFCLK